MAWMGGGRGGCERHGILENSSTVMENRLWGPLCWIRFKLKKNFKAFPFMLTLAYKSYHCGFMPSCLMTWAARQEGTPSFTLVTLSHAAAVCLGLPCPQGVSSCRMSVLGWYQSKVAVTAYRDSHMEIFKIGGINLLLTPWEKFSWRTLSFLWIVNS